MSLLSAVGSELDILYQYEKLFRIEFLSEVA